MAAIQQRIGKNGRITYRVRLRVRGYPIRTATFLRKTDARRWADETELEMRRGQFLESTADRRRTIAEMIDRYVAEVLPGKRQGVRHSQAGHYRWWRNELGAYTVATITPARIAKARDKLGQGRGPATVVRYLGALSHAFTIAIKDWGWTRENPVRFITKPKEPPGRIRFLSKDEHSRLLAACQASEDPSLYDIAILAVCTGMRQGEILKLEWDRVDLDGAVINLRPEDTKNLSPRSIPLVGQALEVLQARTHEDSGLVFAKPGDPGQPAYIRKAWIKAVAQAGITDFRFHDLRHTAASNLAMSGATLLDIAEILGHKTLSMVKRYAHLSPGHTRRVLERMVAKLPR